MTASEEEKAAAQKLPQEDPDLYEKDSESGDENKERGNWAGKLDFLMSCLSYAVGLGNLWRFPYLCYRNGGGAFLIPYIVMNLIIGIPLFFLELSFGQYASSGIVSIWSVCPMFQGIGWGMFLVSCIAGIYYNMIIAWAFFYMFASFASDVPWKTCDNKWNTAACGSISMTGIKDCGKRNGTWFNETCYFPPAQVANMADLAKPNASSAYSFLAVDEEAYSKVLMLINTTEKVKRVSSSDEYFHRYMLDISSGFHEMGEVRWQLALCLLFCWLIVFVCLFKGIKASGKVTYVTALFPYVILIILLVRGLTLPGSREGILFYITPDWALLGSAKVWGDAAVQVFFSLSICWGGLITLASYNKFRNNCFRDALIVSIGDGATAVFAGFVIFAFLGYMAHDLDVPIESVARQGASLAFVVYPQAVTTLPVSPLWSILFFLMLINMGIGTQFSLVTTVHTTLLDVFPGLLRQGKRPIILLGGICFASFLLGLTMCSRGGMFMVQLLDTYSASYTLLWLAIFECIALGWVYGTDRFSQDVALMLGHPPNIFWRICWKFISPLLLVAIMLFVWIDFKPSQYGDYVFPAGIEIMGWMTALVSMLAVPVVAIFQILTKHKDLPLWPRIKKLCEPTAAWGPALEEHRKQAAANGGVSKLADESQLPLNTTNGHLENEDQKEVEMTDMSNNGNDVKV